MIELLVVDDQRLVRRCICAKLNAVEGFEVTGEAASGEQAREIARKQSFDIILMDLNMPGIGGLEATRRLLSTKPTSKIIGLSMYVSGPFPQQFMHAGGAGYVSKNADTEELVTAIKTVHNGVNYISADVAQHIAASGSKLAKRHGIESLSQREVQVLQQISNGASVEDIAANLSLSIKTIAHHRRALLSKLDVRNDVQLATIARVQGLADADSITFGN